MSKSSVLAIAAGAAVGAALGILFAPEKGSDTRRRISDKTSDLASSVKTSFSDFIDELRNSYASAKGEAVEVEEKVSTKMNTLGREVENTFS